MGKKAHAEANASPAKSVQAEAEVEKAEEAKETKEPNAKSKSKAKTKAKAKAKAKAKSVTKQLTKKPSMKEVPKTKDEKAGGKKESLMDKTKVWESLGNKQKQNPDGEEAENEEDDQEEDHDEFRDHGKARKFRKMSDAGAIPAHILDLINEQSKKALNPRKEKSSLINNLFKKNSKGGYDMIADAPVFEQAKEAFFTRFGKDQDTGMPKDVFLWSTFQGNEQALAKAIANGSVQEYNQGGTTFCSFRKTKAGFESGTKQGLHLKSGQVDLDKGQYSALSRAFSSIALTFDDETEEGTEQRAESMGQGKQLKQLEAEGLTQEMTEVLADAKQAHERLHQAAMKLLGKCTNDTDKKKFKETVISIQAWVQKNHNVLTWKESFCCSCCCCFQIC